MLGERQHLRSLSSTGIVRCDYSAEVPTHYRALVGSRVCKKSMATIAEVLSTLPQRSLRYRNAIVATGFVCGVVVAADLITSNQLKSTGYYKYGMRLIRGDARVQAALGAPVNEPLRISTRKQSKDFEMIFHVRGPRDSARIRLASVIDPTRPVIDRTSYQYILVEPSAVGSVGPFFAIDNRAVPPAPSQ